MEVRHADFSSRAGNNDAEDQSCDPGEQRTGLACRAALRDLGANGVEMRWILQIVNNATIV